MVETAGIKLRQARQTRQLSLDDAARATKIRARQLADLESDDYSNFANLAYARSFLVNYGKFLRVDMRPYVDGFADAGTFGMDDYQYLSAKPVGVYRVPHRRSARARRPQRRQLIMAAAGMAVLAVGVFVWILAVNIQRLGDLGTLAARQEAREKASGEGSGAASVDTASTTMPGAASSAPAPGLAPNGSLLVPAPGMVLPIALPANAPNGTETPGPTATPAMVPAHASIPALAAAVEPVTASPVPLFDGRDTVSGMLAAHAGQPLPQKVVNDHPRGR